MNRVKAYHWNKGVASLIFILLPALLLVTSGCVPPQKYATDDYDEVTVFEEIEEAEQIALYLDDDVVLDRFLLKRVFYDMTLIRGAFSKEIEVVQNLQFKAPCKDGRVMIVFDKEIYDSVTAGDYEEWTELNDRYLPYDVKTVDKLQKVYLYFDGLLDYRSLAGKYARLPHVISAECVGHVGDSSNIYPRRTDAGIDYLFRDAWGTCSTGCSSNEFYYFICEKDDAVYVGHWNPQQRVKPPEWWPAARKCLPEELRKRF